MEDKNINNNFTKTIQSLEDVDYSKLWDLVDSIPYNKLLDLIQKNLIDKNISNLNETDKNKIIDFLLNRYFKSVDKVDKESFVKIKNILKAVDSNKFTLENLNYHTYSDESEKNFLKLNPEDGLELVDVGKISTITDKKGNNLDENAHLKLSFLTICLDKMPKKEHEKILNKIFSYKYNAKIIASLTSNKTFRKYILENKLEQKLYDTIIDKEKNKIKFFKKFIGYYLTKEELFNTVLRKSIKYKINKKVYLDNIKSSIKDINSSIKESLDEKLTYICDLITYPPFQYLMLAAGALAISSTALGISIDGYVKSEKTEEFCTQIVENIEEDTNNDFMYSHSTWHTLKNEDGYYIEFLGKMEDGTKTCCTGYKIDEELYNYLSDFVDSKEIYDANNQYIGSQYQVDFKNLKQRDRYELAKTIENITRGGVPSYFKVSDASTETTDLLEK